MSVLSTVIGIIVGGMVLASVGKIYLGIYQTIKQQNLAANKYKVSFKKHFKKVKVTLIKMKVGTIFLQEMSLIKFGTAYI